MSDKIRRSIRGAKPCCMCGNPRYQMNHNADATRPYTGLSLGGFSRNNSPSWAIRSRVRIACEPVLTHSDRVIGRDKPRGTSALMMRPTRAVVGANYLHGPNFFGAG